MATPQRLEENQVPQSPISEMTNDAETIDEIFIVGGTHEATSEVDVADIKACNEVDVDANFTFRNRAADDNDDDSDRCSPSRGRGCIYVRTELADCC